MQGVVGVFGDIEGARQAVPALRALGIPEDKINLLTPGRIAEAAEVPTSDTESPGMGKAVGGVLGGAVGAAAGLSAGSAVASLLIPGVGPVVAIGIAAAGLLGAGGAVAGAVVGKELERDTTEGLPEDELYLYEDALRSGRSVVMAFVNDETQAEQVRDILRDSGAESLDAARERWWIGLRSAEEEHYQTPQPDLAGEQSVTDAESVYRRGFEAALRPSMRGRNYDSATTILRNRFPDLWQHALFIRGYERGHEFDNKMRHATPADAEDAGRRSAA